MSLVSTTPRLANASASWRNTAITCRVSPGTRLTNILLHNHLTVPCTFIISRRRMANFRSELITRLRALICRPASCPRSKAVNHQLRPRPTTLGYLHLPITLPPRHPRHHPHQQWTHRLQPSSRRTLASHRSAAPQSHHVPRAPPSFHYLLCDRSVRPTLATALHTFTTTRHLRRFSVDSRFHLTVACY